PRADKERWRAEVELEPAARDAPAVADDNEGVGQLVAGDDGEVERHDHCELDAGIDRPQRPGTGTRNSEKGDQPRERDDGARRAEAPVEDPSEAMVIQTPNEPVGARPLDLEGSGERRQPGRP